MQFDKNKVLSFRALTSCVETIRTIFLHYKNPPQMDSSKHASRQQQRREEIIYTTDEDYGADMQDKVYKNWMQQDNPDAL